MEHIFSQKFEVSAVHVDCYGRAKPSSLLYFAQEAAGTHCLCLGTDWETLAKRDLFWAVLRHRVQITRLPVLGETVTVQTWPMPTTRSSFPRATVAYDEAGQELFRIISLWVLMNTQSRTMVLPGKSGIALHGSTFGNELTPPGSILPKEMENHTLRYVGYCELDRNGHMNNTRYMDWVDDLLPSAFHAEHPAQEFTVCYLAEALEGQQIDLHWQLDGDGCLQADGHRERTDVPGTKERIFAVQMII